VVHPFNVFLAERISRIIDLDICGIDIMTDDISIPLNESGGAVLEVNAAPGFRMHLDPTGGIGKNVAEPVVDMLFPPGTRAVSPSSRSRARTERPPPPASPRTSCAAWATRWA
jgi:cyanophycin synthetase